jgi:hypothetical protein
MEVSNNTVVWPYTTKVISNHVVEKEWGIEHIIQQQPYAVKIMELKPGFQVSVHWHAEKDETFILISGSLIIETIDQNGDRAFYYLNKPFESITLKHYVPHTFYCLDNQIENTIFIEASTEDKASDSYRFTKSGPRNYTDSGGLTDR